MNDKYVKVRCPRCRKLAAEAMKGSVLRVKCVRCGTLFSWQPRHG